MGAWGVGPFDSDSSLDWLGGHIERPITEAIKRTFQKFLAIRFEPMDVRMVDEKELALRKIVPRKGKKKPDPPWPIPMKKVKMEGRRGYHHHDVEGAAALLDLLTPYSRRRHGWVTTTIKRGKRKLPMFKRKKKPSKKDPLMWGDTGVEIRLNYAAETQELYSLAVKALEEVLADDAYLSSWRSRTEKVLALKSLKKRLEAKVPNQRPLPKRKRRLTGWARNPRRKAQ